ncbi:uncharacterized protein G2W53_016149 [Senna tora]|uniref:Plant bHLH transcription factor ACT-like domain-containing protein n=1 Tax=Senna tora TaxID=362788 RepID=A0A835C6N0_9FABA|nr:uncharacterized protein G2W53_016149 [Senna tora]
MVSKDEKRTAMAMCRNLRLLRSITKSHSNSRNKRSVVLEDACEYIQEELKRKVEKLDEAASLYDAIIGMPMLKVEEEERGFVIKVVSERSCEGLLILILEAIEEVGLDVVEARVSCVHAFSLQVVAVGVGVGTKKDNEEAHDDVDAQLVHQIVFQAIQNWRANVATHS